MFDTRLQSLCAWSGAVGVALFAVSFVAAGFMPPPGPSLSQAEVVAMYQEHHVAIMIGMSIMIIGSMFFSPFVALISIQLRRIEGSTPLMAYTQLSTGTVATIFFIIGPVAFLAAAFRPERSPELTYLVNDYSWIMLVLIWPPFFMQCVSVAVCIFKDASAKPIFPRWLGFLSLWVPVLFIPGTLLPFFHSGPFAWNGIFSFWTPATAFAIWYGVMVTMLLKSIRKQAEEPVSMTNAIGALL